MRDLGIPTLLGVLVGGGITFGIQWWQLSAERKRRRKAAARVMTDRLTGVGAALAVIRDRQGAPTEADLLAMLERSIDEFRLALREHETALVDLPRDVWNAVSNEAQMLRLVVPVSYVSGASSTPKEIGSRLAGLKSAREKLAPYGD